MKDRLFKNLSFYYKQLEKNNNDILFYNKNLLKKYDLEYIGFQTNNEEFNDVGEYTYFKDLTIEHIMMLRFNFDFNNQNHIFWASKIYKFLEYRNNAIKNILIKKYNNKMDRIIFIQNIICFLIEYYHSTKDLRFLSIALKLLRNKSLSKVNFFSNNINGQYCLNIILVKKLIDELNS